MKPQFNNSNSCPCCGRHCPADDLHCSRGRNYFGQEQSQRSKDRHVINIKDETVHLMLQCGHALHHGLKERAENEDILSFLSPSEKKELTSLLKKCVNAWNNN
ncbi:MAG: hypothetical protein Q4G33_04915 [bacterium]|nr:hypothetical protein [bacterium]